MNGRDVPLPSGSVEVVGPERGIVRLQEVTVFAKVFDDFLSLANGKRSDCETFRS
jgi:hypothetical protein